MFSPPSPPSDLKVATNIVGRRRGGSVSQTLSTQINTFSKIWVFVAIENASIDSRPHYPFEGFSAVHTKTFENDKSKETMGILQTHAPVIFSVIVFILMRSFTLIRYVCLFVLIDTFSMKTPSVLVWTQGLNASKCMRFQTKTHWCRRGLSHVNWKSGSYQESMEITSHFPGNASSNCFNDKCSGIDLL